MFNFSSYPTIVIVKKNRVKVANKEHWPRKVFKRRWQYYGGGRETPDDFVFYITALANGKDPFDEERHLRPGFYKAGGKHESDKVTELEPDGEMGFNTTVLEDEKNRVWIVEFYSDRCPFCNSLAPEMIKAAKHIYEHKGQKIRVGAINSRVYNEVAEQHGVTSWPWVTSFYRGKKVEDMAGLGGWESVKNFAFRIYNDVYRKPAPKNTFLDSEWSSANQAKKKAEEEAAGVKEEL
jgi:thiol-disulfide isomerase/thioredoxin